MQKINLSLKILIIAAVAVLTALVYFQQGDFTSIDLGRHLENGKIVWSQPEVLYKNLYSYTEPDFPFVNHHWLAGVIFWPLYLIGGFKILSVLNIVIGLAAIFISVKLAAKRSGLALTAILALPVILILSERVDIRPEMFSNLFIILIFYLLAEFRENKSAKNLIWLLPIFFLWVNTHIYFFIGLFMVGLALLEQIIIHHKNFFRVDCARKLAYYFFGSIAISLANPNFLKGLAYPFTLLTRYGQFSENYEIVENKSPFYLEKLTINQNILLFKILLAILAVSFAVYLIKKAGNNNERPLKSRLFDNFNYLNLFMAGFFSLFAAVYIRNLPAFGLIALPIVAENFQAMAGSLKVKIEKNKTAILALIFITYCLTFFGLVYDNQGKKSFLSRDLGLGVSQNSLDSIKFYRANSLSGPIFNNFDIGSALDFWLYPNERVFVDNRPDVFSREFFREIYIPMQNDEVKWKDYSEKYKINLIYFSHTDGTPWGREFLASRLKDENWPLIYFDDYALIMIRSNENNQALIEKYKINAVKFASRLNELLAGAQDNGKMHLADLALAYGRADLAENIYSGLLKERPDDGKVLAALGFLYSAGPNRENVVKSIDYLNKAIASGYVLPAVYNQLGLDYWNLQDYTEAKNMWRRARKIDAGNEHAKYYLKQANELTR